MDIFNENNLSLCYDSNNNNHIYKHENSISQREFENNKSNGKIILMSIIVLRRKLV